MSGRPIADFSVPEAQPIYLHGGDHGVLLIHGFTGSAAHMRPLAEHLHSQGFTVMSINLPGHATSMEEMGKTDWKQWLQAAKMACAQLKENCRYVSAMGLSMGGVLTLLLAEQMGLTAAIPVSTPMAVQNKGLPFARLIAPFMPVIMWRSNPERAKMLDPRYDLGYLGFPTKKGSDLSHLIRIARKNLHAVTCPILVVQSHADETITPDSADIILHGVSSERKGVLWLHEVPHVCTITCETENIAHAACEMLREAEKKE